MKRKAIIFPYNAECASLVRNRELLLNHEIVACVSPIGYGLQGKDAAYAYGGENTGIVISDKKISEINFDDLLVCESSSDFDTFIMPQVKLAAECGKNVIFLYNISQQQKKEAEETCKKKNVKCVVLTNRRMDTDKLFEHEIIPLSVPVVFVASVIENTNKFDVQLGLRKFLQEEGYKVSQIGTKEYCELFGFHAIPEFMYANQLSEADKIVWFNRICKSIELQEKPDIFIIGVPGATMVFNETITNNFGITAFEIANAVRPDTAIMCVPYEGYDSGFLKMIQTSSKYKLDMQVDCFNIGYFTFPASFTNVIGVANVESPLSYSKDYIHLGIDTVTISEHIIMLENKEHKTSPSNSYAAPYICALIANKLSNDKTLDIVKLKRYAKEQSHIEMTVDSYEPDWIYRAYISGRGTMSRAEYYFETVTGVYDEIQGKIDTVIAYSMAELENLDIRNKNLIYLGHEDIHNIDVQGFIWSKETRQRQIKHNHYQGNGLEVPVVILAVEDVIDKFYILTELKRAFANGGYNAYTIGMEPECVLYALEYMPEPVSDIDAWKNFIESQTFYKQSDLVIWCIPVEEQDKYLKVYPDCDVQISLCNEGDINIVRFSFEGEKIEKKISGLIDRKDVEKIYHIIEAKLTEEEDG